MPALGEAFARHTAEPATFWYSTARRAPRAAAVCDANLLVVDGDPTRDISATERISTVVLKGERVRRVDLFTPRKTRYSRSESGNWVLGEVIGATLKVVKKKIARKTAKPRRKR